MLGHREGDVAARRNRNNRHGGVFDNLFSDAAEMKMGFGPAGGHDHHVDMFFFDKFQDFLGRVTNRDMAKFLGAAFEMVAADLAQLLFGFFVQPGQHFLDMIRFEIAVPLRVVKNGVVDDIENVDFGSIGLGQGFDVIQGLFGLVGEIRGPENLLQGHGGPPFPADGRRCRSSERQLTFL